MLHSSDVLLLLTVLIKLQSSTNEAKGLDMEMSNGNRMTGYDLLARDLQKQQFEVRTRRTPKWTSNLKCFILPKITTRHIILVVRKVESNKANLVFWKRFPKPARENFHNTYICSGFMFLINTALLITSPGAFSHSWEEELSWCCVKSAACVKWWIGILL